MRHPENLHAFQRGGVGFLHAHDGALLVAPVGSGKTATLGTAAADALREGRAVRFLVLCPMRVGQLVWPAELKEWSHLAHLRVGVAAGAGLAKREAILADRNLDIVTLNYDLLPWLCERFKPGELPFDAIILDEVSALKSVSTQRFKKFRPHLPKFRIRWGATATPTANSLLDIWGPVYCADLGASLGRSFYEWQRRCFYPTDFKGYKWKPLPGMEQTIREAIRSCAFVLDSANTVDLPDLVHNRIEVVLPPEALKTYDELAETLVTQLDEGQNIFASSQGVLTTKLWSAGQGALYDPEHNARPLHTAKYEALVETIEALNGAPCLVFYWFQFERTAIAARLKDAVFLSDMTEAEAVKTIEAWNRGEIEVLCLHPASAGHGINLQHGGSNMIWTGPIWSSELWEQAIGRLHRQGQKANVFCHTLVARDTLDGRILTALEEKTDIRKTLIDGLLERVDTKAN